MKRIATGQHADAFAAAQPGDFFDRGFDRALPAALFGKVHVAHEAQMPVAAKHHFRIGNQRLGEIGETVEPVFSYADDGEPAVSHVRAPSAACK